MATSNKFLSVEQMRETRNVDRLLPSQPLQRQSFVGNESQFLASLESLMLQQQMAKSVEEKWDIRLKLGVTYASLGSEIGTLYFYQMLMRFGRVKTALELGTYIGVSTLFLAEAVGENGRVTTVEFGKEFHDIARENFIRNGYMATKSSLSSAPRSMYSVIMPKMAPNSTLSCSTLQKTSTAKCSKTRLLAPSQAAFSWSTIS